MATETKGTATAFTLDRNSLDGVFTKIEELVREGSVHRVSVKDRAGNTVIEAPLTLGVVGAALAPVWAAIGAIAALAADFTVHVERRA
jgi:uncharacterized protein DUF4342